MNDDRDPECVKRWPDCYEGGYDPACCRFPKSCSCTVNHTPPADKRGCPCCKGVALGRGD